jgi:predicted hydrolase (HD superfamily)
MINREEAFVLLRKYIKDQDLIRYSIAVEALLREIAKKLQKDEELWGLVGLLHNLDYQYTIREPEKRGSLSAQILEGLLSESGINAIKANNYMHTSYIPVSSLDKSLIAADAITGFIFSTARAIPSKSLSDVDTSILLSKFNDPTFAPDHNRSKIRLCVDVGIELEFFLALCLYTLQKTSFDINP